MPESAGAEHELPWTGERYVPGHGGPQLAYEHRHRYLAAMSLARGARVVDLGCGEGYGSSWLAGVADHVLGVDIAPDATRHARARYHGIPTLSFLTADARRVPVRTGSIDLVVCVEVLEHVEDQGALLDEIDRMLDANGVLVISTPDKAVYTDTLGSANAFHTHELYRHEFESLLRTRFGACSLRGQRVVGGSLLWPLGSVDPPSTAEVVFTTGAADAIPVSGPTGDLVYLVAVCARSESALARGAARPSLYLDGAQELVHAADPGNASDVMWEFERGLLRAQLERAGEVIEARDEAIAWLRREATTAASSSEARWELERGLLRTQLERARETIEFRNEGIAWLRRELAQYHETVETARSQASRLAEIEGSRAWRALTRYRLLRTRLRHARRSRRHHQPVVAAAALPADLDELPLPAPERYDIVCFSIIPWDFRWQRPQQVMSKLADVGHRVFYLRMDHYLPPGGPSYELSQVRDNVWLVTVAAPSFFDINGRPTDDETTAMVVVGLDALRRDAGITDAISYTHVATWLPVVERARDLFAWRVLYDCMDEWEGFPGVSPHVIEAETRLARSADVLVVTAARLRDKWLSAGLEPVLVRNAVNIEDFVRAGLPRILDGIDSPIVGFIGGIAPWFDLDLMTEVVALRPQYHFVFVGDVELVDSAALASHPNVTMVSRQAHKMMAAYLKRFDVCVIPFVGDRITRATDPVKFYEYLALGKPVVMTPLPELTEHEDLAYVAGDPSAFTRKLDDAIGETDPRLVERRMEFARANTWADRIRTIEEAVERSYPRLSVVVVAYENVELTERCIQSVLSNTPYPNLELVVIDNASTDATPEYLRSLATGDERVHVVINEDNRGFAAAVNQGLETAQGEQLVILNNDVIVPNGALNRLVCHLDRSDVGLVVAVTNFAGNEACIAVGYDDPSQLERWAVPYMRAHEREHFEIRVAAMYCVALRAETYRKVGPLDEQFTVGLFEDDDYSHRVRIAGLRVICAEDCFVHHVGRAAFSRLTPAEVQAIWDANQHRFETKWKVDWEEHRLRPGATPLTL